MTFTENCPVYHYAFHKGMVTKITEEYIDVKFNTIKKRYNKSCKNELIFCDERDCISFYSKYLKNCSSEELYNNKFDETRRINEYRTLINKLITINSKNAKRMARETLEYLYGGENENNDYFDFIDQIVYDLLKKNEKKEVEEIILKHKSPNSYKAYVKYLLDQVETCDEIDKIYNNLCNKAKLEDMNQYLNEVYSTYKFSDKKLQDYKEKESQFAITNPIAEIDKYMNDHSLTEEYLSSRNIKHFVHFTHIDNLDSILKHGILPKPSRDKLNINSVNSDTNTPNRTSVSIEFPNFIMLKNKLYQIPKSDWVIIYIDAKKLLKSEERYKKIVEGQPFYCYTTNSARNGIAPSNFSDLFKEKCISKRNNEQLSRTEMNIPNCYTTDPQAEITCGIEIPPEMITKIEFGSEDNQKKYSELLGQNNIESSFGLIDRIRSTEYYKVWYEKGGYGNNGN